MSTSFIKPLSAASVCTAIICITGCLGLEGTDSHSSDNCAACHPTPVAEDANHNVSEGTAYNLPCVLCHEGYSIDPPLLNRRDHLNGTSEVVFDTAAMAKFGPAGAITWEKSGGTCFNIPCHGYGRVEPEAKDQDNITWLVSASLGEALDCKGCHDHSAHRMAGMACSKCHAAVVAGSDDNIITDLSLHINGIVEVNEGMAGSPP